jgi:FixJ family two-component response regulator
MPRPNLPVPPAPRPSISLIEDDAAVRDAVRFSLEAEGFAVDTWESAELMLAAEIPAATICLIVDFCLGGMSGIEAVEELRRRGVDLPVIMMTTVPPLILREWVARTHTPLIEKPLLDDILIGAIREVAV